MKAITLIFPERLWCRIILIKAACRQSIGIGHKQIYLKIEWAIHGKANSGMGRIYD